MPCLGEPHGGGYVGPGVVRRREEERHHRELGVTDLDHTVNDNAEIGAVVVQEGRLDMEIGA